MSTDTKLKKYFYFGFCYYMIISESDYIEVMVKDKNFAVVKKNISDIVDLILRDGREVTKEEFLEVFHTALSHCNHAYFMEAYRKPATDEDMRECCACDEEMTYEEMLSEAQQNELWGRNERIINALTDINHAAMIEFSDVSAKEKELRILEGNDIQLAKI